MTTANDALESFTITDATVVNDTTFSFVAVASDTHERWKDGDDFPTRLVTHDVSRPSWSWLEFEQFSVARVAGAVRQNGKKVSLFTNIHRQVAAFNYKDGTNDLEPAMPSPPDFAGPTKIAFIGDHFYGVSYNLIVMKRNSPGQWESLHFAEGGAQLRCLDGYSESDIYVAGSDQTLMHYDGATWMKQQLPLDAMEESFRGIALVCAPDGVVYVGGHDGQLLAGESGGRWELLISEDESPIGPVRSMTWFKGTLYASGDHALFRFVDGKWELAHFPDSERQPVGASHVDSNDDVMLLAGPYSASIYDGSQWTPIYGDYDDLDLMRLQLAEKLVDDLETIRDTAKDVARAVREQE